MKKVIAFLFVSVCTYVNAYYQDLYPEHAPIKIYQTIVEKHWVTPYCKTFDQYGINYERVSSFVKGDTSLYILSQTPPSSVGLPKNYIWVNTHTHEEFSDAKLAIMKNAIAVWDVSWENIAKYKENVPHYYYMPPNYKYADPGILPCFLPTEALAGYKKVLAHSNQKINDLSSHLPAIYVHTYLQNPEKVLELGVCSGIATEAFYHSTQHNEAKVIGVDPDAAWDKSYARYKTPRMKFINDHHLSWISRLPMNQKFDLIFLDTSHLYDDTMDELRNISPRLAAKGIWMLHDSHMSPLEDFGWETLNNVTAYRGWDNEKGVARAIKAFFLPSFDETIYNNTKPFSIYGNNWKLIHYPFSNGLTIIKKL